MMTPLWGYTKFLTKWQQTRMFPGDLHSSVNQQMHTLKWQILVIFSDNNHFGIILRVHTTKQYSSFSRWPRHRYYFLHEHKMAAKKCLTEKCSLLCPKCIVDDNNEYFYWWGVSSTVMWFPKFTLQEKVFPNVLHLGFIPKINMRWQQWVFSWWHILSCYSQDKH